MENNNIEVFQTDSEIIKKTFQTNPNFIIQHDDSVSKGFCAIYFSSNFIYYPNDEATFRDSIITNNRFEWTNLKVTYAQKHIFIRDIKKQWYLDGINSTLNSPEKLLEFLKIETKGMKVITVGSSAGGYAAVLYGQLLNAYRTYCFNGQFELLSLLKSSTENIDPLIFRNRENAALLPYYDLKNFLLNPKSIYYFVSIRSDWDKNQWENIRSLGIPTVYFKTGHHGVPFPKILLPMILNSSFINLELLVGKQFNPVIFCIRRVGLFKTIKFLFKTIYIKYFC